MERIPFFSNPARPRLVTAISALFFAAGVLSILSILMAGTILSRDFNPMYGIYFIFGIYSITISIGLMKLKKWAIYTHIVVAIIATIALELMRLIDLPGAAEIAGQRKVIDYLAPLAIVVYLWSVRNKFS